MMFPELLIFLAADEVFAGLLVRHSFLGAIEIGSDVEEVEGEEDHGCDHPFEGEDEEDGELVA